MALVIRRNENSAKIKPIEDKKKKSTTYETGNGGRLTITRPAESKKSSRMTPPVTQPSALGTMVQEKTQTPKFGLSSPWTGLKLTGDPKEDALGISNQMKDLGLPIRRAEREQKERQAGQAAWEGYQESQKEYDRLMGLDVQGVQNDIDALTEYQADLERLYKNKRIDPTPQWTGADTFLHTGEKTDAAKEKERREKELHRVDDQLRKLQDDLAGHDRLRQIADFESVREAPDFQETSQYRSTRKSEEELEALRKANESAPLHFLMPDMGFTEYRDMDYDYINKDSDAVRSRENFDAQTGLTALGVDRSFLQELTEDEVAVFNSIYYNQSPEKAYEYVQLLSQDLTGRQRRKTEREWRAYARKHPVQSSAFTVLTSPMKGASYLGQAVDYLDDGKIDQNAAYNRFSYIPTAVRGQVAQDVEKYWVDRGHEFGGKTASFLYQTGMSMGDFLTNTAVTGGNQALSLAIMGTGAAADGTIAAKDRGLSDGQAFAIGTVAGLAEVVTEKVSLEALLKPDWEKGALVYVLKNVLAEGSEEVASDAINLFADVLIAKDKSEWVRSVAAYEADGKDPDQAFILAVKDQALAMGVDFLGGALSGGIMSGVAAGGHVMSNYNTGKTLRGAEQSSGDGAQAADGRYSLKEFEDGRRFVDVDTDQKRFDGLSLEEMGYEARKVIKEKFKGKVIGIDNRVFVNGKTAEEYGHPQKKLPIMEHMAKMRASTELDNLLDAGTNFRTEPDGRDGHIHPGSVDDFRYFDTIFKVGGEYYSGVINIEPVAKGLLLKDITQIRNITQDTHASYGENPQGRFLRDVSMDSIRQEGGKSNGKFDRKKSGGKPGSTARSTDAFGQSGQKALMAGFRKGQDAAAYYAGFANYYQAGLAGVELEKAYAPYGQALDSAQRFMAWAAGQNDAKTYRAQELETAKRAVSAGKDSGLSQDDYRYAAEIYGAEVAQRLHRLGEKLGTGIIFADTVGENSMANGEQLGETILLSRDMSDPVLFVAGHEVLHRLQELAPEEYIAFREAVAPELTPRAEAIMDLYESKGLSITYEGALNEAAADYAGRMLEDGKLMDEFIARNRDNRTLLEKLRDAFRALIDKLTGREKQQAQSAEARLTAALEAGAKRAGELSQQGQAQTTETAEETGDGKMSLKETTTGKLVVVVNDDILREAVSEADQILTVKKYLGRFKRVPIKGQSIYFLGSMRHEYTGSKYTRRLKRSDAITYNDKLRLAGHPQDIVYATTNYINESPKHPRKDNIIDFARGELLADIGGNQYRAEVVIGFTKKGICGLYDVVNLVPTQFEYKESNYPIVIDMEQDARSDYDGVAADKRVSQSEDTVNQKLSLKKTELLQGETAPTQMEGLSAVPEGEPIGLTVRQRLTLDEVRYAGHSIEQVGMALKRMGPEAIRGVINQGLQASHDAGSHIRAQMLQKELDAGRDITPSELGHLYDALCREPTQWGVSSGQDVIPVRTEEDGKAGAATDSIRNTGRRVHFNKLAKWKFEVPGYSAEVSAGLSGAARKVAELGGKDGLEHLELIDLRTGESVFSEIGDESSVGYDFRRIIEAHPKARFAFVHNHNTDGWISEQDLITLLTTDQIDVMIAVRNDGIIYVAPKNAGASIPHHPMQYYKSDMDEISKLNREGKLTEPFRYAREKKIVENMLRDFVKGYFEYDGT